jgi:hypothetical protein
MTAQLGIGSVGRVSRRFVGARLVLGSALVAAAATFAVAWPGETQADGLVQTVEQKQAEQDELFAAGATEHGSLLAVTRLVVPDEKKPGSYALEILVRNKSGEGTECARVEACLERTVYNPMDRGAPPPTIVWRTKDTTCVGPGETLAKRVPIPAGFGVRIHQSTLPPRTTKEGMPIGPTVAFASNIVAMTPAAPSGAAAQPPAESQIVAVSTVSKQRPRASKPAPDLMW